MVPRLNQNKSAKSEQIEVQRRRRQNLVYTVAPVLDWTVTGAKSVCWDAALIPVREIIYLDFILYSVTDSYRRDTAPFTMALQDQQPEPVLTRLPCLTSFSTSWNATTAGRYQQRIAVELCPHSGLSILALNIVSGNR